jgi:hypothetical protein
MNTTPPKESAEGGARRQTLFEMPERPQPVCDPQPPGTPRVKVADRSEARVMKMGDGGYRPAYNVQLATDEAKLIYRERASTAECVNAIARNRGLQQFGVRGRPKVRAVILLYVLAHNLIRAAALRAAAEAKAS